MLADWCLLTGAMGISFMYVIEHNLSYHTSSVANDIITIYPTSNILYTYIVPSISYIQVSYIFAKQGLFLRVAGSSMQVATLSIIINEPINELDRLDDRF